MCSCPVGTATKGITHWYYHIGLLLSSSPLYVHWNHPCTVASSEILPGQFVISPNISWPPLPPSSPLCTGIICGQVIISEIIPMTSILKLVDHICGDLFQSNGELTNSHLVNFDLMVYRSHLVLA